jgi:hypothetical protein
MAGAHAFVFKLFHVLRQTSDGLGGISDSHPELNLGPDFLSTGNHPRLEISNCPAHQVVLDLLREYPAPSVTYVALGPLTGLAQMQRSDGACVCERICHVVIMRGAIDMPGNATPSAECACLSFPMTCWSCSHYIVTISQFLCRSICGRRGAGIAGHAVATRSRASPPTRYYHLPLTPLRGLYFAYRSFVCSRQPICSYRQETSTTSG